MIIEPRATDAPIVSIREGLGRRAYPPNSTIFAEGEAGTLAYVLLRGDVTIFLRFGTAQQRAVTELKPPEMFGIHALMAGAQRAATAYTKNGCELLAVSETRLRQKLEEADPFLRYWVDYLSKRINDLST
ncbi:cyclic nucleotide-binding domain-containing protein [Bradyrhizobium sp. CCGB12]|uniref:cyclic nucleotide-binding domain-containing protein n=1 Tax=Bradyrhizobium sp. CCGB12 TaxID=2949632 RepID=UPI0020B3E0F3|nr:cyclic nucleotide-binding domain-containing protein [Bradyrhizobium sp. CCGB12]MCP3391903.1 cyclic nucleotide-binding domain-containing protein [Bradyrhizobium sp. CCGB12]